MLCFVTGATGFIGSNLVHELAERGHRVKVLIRPGGDSRILKGTDFEAFTGDLSDQRKLQKAMRGCDWCFHLAASYSLWLRDYRSMYEANVGGTRNVLTAATEAGCSRIIYTSTAGCIGLSNGGAQGGSDENAPVHPQEISNDYKRSKWQAEQVAREFAANKSPVIIVNPTAPIGPRDVKPTPTGKLVVDFISGAMPAYVDCGLNWVHVRDVAMGHVLAAEKGLVGERYILGNAEGNWTLEETLKQLAEIAGVRAPKTRLPYWVALTVAYLSEAVAGITGKPPKASLAGVRMAKWKMFFRPQKAVRELGMPQTPVKTAFAEAVEWFRRNGYVKRR